MPAPILTQTATITCPHGGQCIPVVQNPGLLIMGSPVLTVSDVFMIAGCPFNISGAPAPCLNIQWTMPATQTMVRGVPVLLATSVGMCLGGSGSVPAVVIPGQAQVLGS